MTQADRQRREHDENAYPSWGQPAEAGDGEAGAAAGDPAGHIRRVLERVQAGRASVEQGLTALRDLPFEDLGFARLDHHRGLRTGFSEVIYCEGKTAEEVAVLIERAAAQTDQVLATRASEAQYEAARARLPALHWDGRCRLIWHDAAPDRARLGGVAVVAAGTSDLPVAEEAARTLELMGHRPARIGDVGVAGLHRLTASLDRIRQANVVVVVAGMEGALPSVVAGLVSAPVIAVPTSVGYGASMNGLAAMMGMLSACAPGLSVVNIDNGFGAGHMAATINRMVHQGGAETGEERAVE
jgi:NCAIR mutase (PurE)-related protein